MRIIDLKRMIENLPDDMEVMFYGEDEFFSHVGNCSKVRKAELVEDMIYMEYQDDSNKADPDNPVVDIFCLDNTTLD